MDRSLPGAPSRGFLFRVCVACNNLINGINCWQQHMLKIQSFSSPENFFILLFEKKLMMMGHASVAATY
jgi:hypothetical protein